ncbi:MAG: sulfatase-like hydrolase/transferase [Bryobacteraceae bacterium]
MSRIVWFLLAGWIAQAGYAGPSTPVILISVDTLRADHLNCYQPGNGQTPRIDSLAAGGTLFSDVSSPYPLTLPSHVALFTSTYPFTNGVLDNGVPLKSTAVTLATVLKNAGYRTGAFVGSFVLDRRFGLNRGFDVYDGPLDVHNKTSAGVTERKRPGAQVAEAAMRWVDRNADAPFFLFLHLYDLHLPYDLPQDPNLRHGDTGYRAELAYVDRVIGDFLAFLERRRVMRKALVVFTSDHGEGLGEHGESTHGYFIYQSTLHVPLIVHWPAGSRRVAKDRVDGPASLLDVAPTILEAVGMARPAEMKGRSLLESGDREVYSESVYARNHFSCAPLRSLRVGSFKYIEAPKPELYDLAVDSREQRNLYGQQRARAADMSARIVELRSVSTSAIAQTPAPGADTVKALRSLGYLAGTSASSRRDSKVDPKDRILDFERYVDALGLASAGKVSESTRQLETLRARIPDVTDLRIALGQNHQRNGDFGSAAREFKAAVEQDPSDAQARYELGFCYFHLRQIDDAIRELNTALKLESWYTRADEALADIFIQKKDFPQARAHLKHLLSIDPNSYTAHYNLGIFAALENNPNLAEQHLVSALRADPGSAEAHDTLGGIYFQRGDLERARREFEEAIRIQSSLGVSHYHLGMVYQKQGNRALAEQQFRLALESGGPAEH